MRLSRLRHPYIPWLIVISLLVPHIVIWAQGTGFPTIQSIAWSPNGGLIAVGPGLYSAE